MLRGVAMFRRLARPSLFSVVLAIVLLLVAASLLFNAFVSPSLGHFELHRVIRPSPSQ